MWRRQSASATSCTENAEGPLATPLVRAGSEAAAIDGLLDALDQGRLGCAVLELQQVAEDSVFHGCLRERLAARGQPWLDLGCRERAIFRPRATAETYLEAAQGGGRRRKLGQLRRQLERQGRLDMRRLEQGEDVEPWIGAFLALERSGWKGRSGTALASTAEGETLFRRLAAALHAEGRLVMYGLWLDARPIALHCAFLSAADHGEAFAFKIAYDEAYARQSPGVQLETWALGELHGPRPMARRIDSCAGAGQQLWNELWLDRRRLAHLIIGPRGAGGRALIESLRLGRRLRQELAGLRQA